RRDIARSGVEGTGATRHRRYVHDGTSRLGQGREKGATHQVGPGEIDVDGLIPGSLVDRLNAAQLSYPGSVDESRQLSPCLHETNGEILDRPGIGDVE